MKSNVIQNHPHSIFNNSKKKNRSLKDTPFSSSFSLRTPLHAAAYTDHVECLQLLLGHNAQVNAIDALGKTPLMMAAENGQTNAVGKTRAASVHPVDHRLTTMCGFCPS